MESLSHLTASRPTWHDNFEFLSMCEVAAGGTFDMQWKKTEGEVSSGSYLDAIGIGESGFSSILGMSNISLFIFLFPCIHYNGWMIWGFLVFEWSYCSIPTHDKRLWNAVHLANSQWFQTFQTQSVEQISLLPVISEKHRRQVGHVSVAFYVTVWQLKMHQGASFPSICAVIPTVLLIRFLLPQ